jgi:hypothetical protein
METKMADWNQPRTLMTSGTKYSVICDTGTWYQDELSRYSDRRDD